MARSVWFVEPLSTGVSLHCAQDEGQDPVRLEGNQGRQR